LFAHYHEAPKTIYSKANILKFHGISIHKEKKEGQGRKKRKQTKLLGTFQSVQQMGFSTSCRYIIISPLGSFARNAKTKSGHTYPDASILPFEDIETP